MATSRKLFGLCSVLMGSLFAYSASVQLNDPDWYFWFPLYSCACIVNMTNRTISAKITRQIAVTALWLGIFLFLKVVFQDFVHGIAGFWSLDLSERVVREKTGSVLVIASMILQLKASFMPNDPTKKHQREFSSLVNYGMLTLVAFSYMLSLSFLFFAVQKGEMKF
ncbi:hypothetical protein L6164_019984 [Bauhinia variegata]|uniref:Uncharacterized protein n=1 Tax=Bauhinia variegata TaxID=167791 RepID=A0ACB9MTP4_BAUVA|nr:hypothetical protein L6164_019984 [Bauhinia variegata]